MLHNIYHKFPSFLAPPFAAAIGALFLLLLVTVASTAQPALPAGTTVWLQGPADSVHLGDTTTVTIRISGVVDLYGAQVALSFDPDNLQVVDADPAEPGVQITPDRCPAPDFMVQNQADNAAGTIGYAVTQLNPTPPVNGDCSMAFIQFQTQQVTTALLAFGEVILADRDGTAIAHSVLGLTINILDDEPPTGSILVNGGDVHTNHPTVDLTLAAVDNVGVTGMRLFHDGSWGDWEPYAGAKTLTLAGIDGTRVISVEYRDAAGNPSSTYSDTIILDTTPPSGSISIDNGAAYATSTSVSLELSAADPGSGVVETRFSNDDSTWSSWESYTTSKSWTLTSGDGAKTVSVEYRDAAGNTSSAYSDTIILDTTPPSGSISVDSGAAYAASTSVTLALSAADSGSGVAEKRLSNDGSTWSSWESYTTSKSWTLASADGAKTIYVEYRDAAGNTSSAYSDSIILDTTPPTSAVEALPALQDDISLTVSWSGADATSDILCYDIQYRDGAGGEWTDWQICVTDLSATFAGTAGRTYYFRSRAQDPAGNWESYPIDPDGDTHTTLREPPYPPADPYKVFLPIIPRQ